MNVRKTMKKLLTVLLLSSAFPLMTAFAAMAARSDLSYVPKTITYQITDPMTTYAIPCDKGGKILKSSFKATGKAYAKISYNYNASEKLTYITTEPIKPGKASVSFKYKWKGTTKKYTFRFVIEKYVCPVKTFKIGTRNYTSAFKTDFKKSISKKVSGKVNIKAKKGWTLESIAFTNNGQYKEIKNGTKVTLTKDAKVMASFRDAKGEYSTLQVAYWG